MLESVERARALLEEVTPLKWDCGALCGSACCLPDADGQGGVWLLPGEEEALEGAIWARIVPGDPPTLMCDGPCERAARPFFCRLFPLIGVYLGNRWVVRMDRRASHMCPLTGSGAKGLNPGFTDAALEAVKLLSRDERVLPLLIKWARMEREFAGSLNLEDRDAGD